MFDRRHFLSAAGGVTVAAGAPLRPSRAQAGHREPGDAGVRIDRRALVSRHNVVRTSANQKWPLQVGNGSFAFNVDVTGLQTFTPFNTMANWAWYSAPLPPGQKPSDFQGQVWDTHGRPVRYWIPNDTQTALSDWMRMYPQLISLGRIGLRPVTRDGRDATSGDLTDCRQELDLWTGTLDSRFKVDGEPVRVRTCCHPDVDAVAVTVESPLIAAGRLSVFVDLPFVDTLTKAAVFVGDWDHPDAHETSLVRRAGRRADITHTLGGLHDTTYHVGLRWSAGAELTAPARAPLTITSARYGAGSSWADVTDRLRAKVADDSLFATVDADLVGTDTGADDVLAVAYRYGDEARRERVATGARLRIGRLAEKHRYTLTGGEHGRVEFVCVFSPETARSLPRPDAVFAAGARHWPRFWRSGGAVDLSGSTDPRWFELERRIVLSQYLEAVNDAGSFPTQESGLVLRTWWGKALMEMYWWHAAHWALWNRWDILDRSVTIFQRMLPSSRRRAAAQGYKGAKWPKMIGPDLRQSPGETNVLLIWQQPHPMFLAELDYRAHPTRETLEKWREVLFATADFLASYAFWDEPTKRYILGPPLQVMSENVDPKVAMNPAFELSYWRFGLRIAQTWRERLGLTRDPDWDKVLHGLAELPVQDGVYVLYEGVPDMWTKYNFDHPGPAVVYGWLPGDGVDMNTFLRTAHKVFAEWRVDKFSWDFPMLAMTAARIGEPERALHWLLYPGGADNIDDAGYGDTHGYPYFPDNSGLLYAVAFMCAGWDGAPDRHAPGFPDDGTWTVRWENLSPAL
ncbi:hypothetical protein [Actinoallomurus sp. NPDC050550]|uniref:hypothetical protein n=1 Tax=Actinoallomurus sp. NPDC050550 TaxID=3154937 RepID=UPI0033DA9A21